MHVDWQENENYGFIFLLEKSFQELDSKSVWFSFKITQTSSSSCWLSLTSLI